MADRLTSSLLPKGRGNSDSDGCGHCHGDAHAHGHGDHSGSRGHAHTSADHCTTGPSGLPLAAPARHEPLVFDTLTNSVQWLTAHDPAECESKCRAPVDSLHVSCDQSALNSTTNLLVVVRANEILMMSRVNTGLAIISVLYMAVNVSCFILNSYDNECDPKAPGCSPATTPYLFHSLEFWATFVFNLVDLLALGYSPRTLSNQYKNPVVLKLLVLLNIGMSFWSCLLVTINLEKFEVFSHELEYANELTLTIFDATILVSLVRGRSHEQMRSQRWVSIMSLLAAGIVATVQLGVYNLSGWTADGDSKGEQMSHYLEFGFGIISAGITFWFTMDNRLCAEKRLCQIMYGPGEMA